MLINLVLLVFRQIIRFMRRYNTDIQTHIKFFDENTQQWWTPLTGGANVPALNELLVGYGAQLGDDVYRGIFKSFFFFF